MNVIGPILFGMIIGIVIGILIQSKNSGSVNVLMKIGKEINRLIKRIFHKSS